jgi:hypothetical protein
MAQAIIKNTHQEVVVKVWGASGVTEVIDISTLLAAGQAVDGATQSVTITGVQWTGAPGGVATITRNNETIMTLQAAPTGMLLFDGQTMPSENRQATSDISVAITVAAAEVWIKMRKVSGYATFIEDATYGHYDDPTRIGASTTKSGSPDKV